MSGMPPRAMIVTPLQQFRRRGSGLFEFAVAVIVIGILSTILLNRMHAYQLEAERVAVDMTVANLREALKIRLAEGNLPGRKPDLDELAEQNPLNWLAEKPRNYAGEFYAPARQDVQPGNWYFDRRDKTLVYLLNTGKTFSLSQLYALKFKVKFNRLPTNLAKPTGAPPQDGVTLEQIQG
ncbi:hypothetical protein HSX11_16955 [Oxalobacteraceae bacterium]|nr:hypothetical protein [Oxalobacteraceae bacterium]